MNPQSPVVCKSDENVESGEKALASITVASRIPEFWADQTRLWFVQFEAAVENQRLSDAAKQNLVVTKLSKSAIQQVSDLILAPPEARKYQTLKERLLQVFEETETRKLQKLIGEMELGDQRPSQLLRRMRELARGKVPDDTLRLMWQSHLPTAVRAILTVTDSKDLTVLAAVADKVLESTGSNTGQIAEVKTTTSQEQTPADGADYNRIMREIAKINKRLDGLERGRSTQRQGNRQHSKSGSRMRSKSHSRKGSNWLCFYHFRYKEKATKCVKPCNWSDGQAQPTEN